MTETDFDINLKKGDVDTAGAIIQDDDWPVDLTGKSVTFIMLNESGTQIEIDCELGGEVGGEDIPYTEGGVSIPFISTETNTPGLYRGYFLVDDCRYPGANEYISVMIRDLTANMLTLQQELQTTIPAGYSDSYIDSMFEAAENLLKLKTNRLKFSGMAASLKDQAVLYLVIDRLAASNRDLLKGSIKEIDENGSKIVFSNGKDLESYKKDAEYLISSLKLSGKTASDRTTFTNMRTFYR